MTNKLWYVILILTTEDNYKNWISFPSHIDEKIKTGVITRTHLSDLIRLELLEKYGFQNIDLRKNFKIEKLINIMLHDKKAHNNKLTFIIPTDKKTVELIELSQNEIREMF